MTNQQHQPTVKEIQLGLSSHKKENKSEVNNKGQLNVRNDTSTLWAYQGVGFGPAQYYHDHPTDLAREMVDKRMPNKRALQTCYFFLSRVKDL